MVKNKKEKGVEYLVGMRKRSRVFGWNEKEKEMWSIWLEMRKRKGGGIFGWNEKERWSVWLEMRKRQRGRVSGWK